MAIDVESRIGPAARLARNIDCSILWRNFDVTMQAITVGPGKDWHRRPKRCPAIDTQRADCVRDILRAVVDRILVAAGSSSGKRGRKWAAADRLVIDTRDNSGALANAESPAIVISDICR